VTVVIAIISMTSSLPSTHSLPSALQPPSLPLPPTPPTASPQAEPPPNRPPIPSPLPYPTILRVRHLYLCHCGHHYQRSVTVTVAVLVGFGPLYCGHPFHRLHAPSHHRMIASCRWTAVGRDGAVVRAAEAYVHSQASREGGGDASGGGTVTSTVVMGECGDGRGLQPGMKVAQRQCRRGRERMDESCRGEQTDERSGERIPTPKWRYPGRIPSMPKAEY